MKQILALTLTLVLTAALLMGCGCTNQDMPATSAPTILPTNEEVMPTTRETTRPTTEATTTPTTMSTEPSATIDRGNGPLEDNTLPSTAEGSTRAMPKH